VLGLASTNEDNFNEELLPPHFTVPVGLWRGSGGNGYYPNSSLVDFGATYKFISQTVADGLSPEAARLGKMYKKIKLPPAITTVNGEPLRATTVIRQLVRIQDNAGRMWSNAINFVFADITHYNMILSMS
jgi:hypothetical protein